MGTMISELTKENPEYAEEIKAVAEKQNQVSLLAVETSLEV